jgi:monoterpene epsilon-lactone hydrolase
MSSAPGMLERISVASPAAPQPSATLSCTQEVPHMVMAERPDVRTSTAPIAAVDVIGLMQQMTNALVRVPFRSPLKGPAGRAHNLGQTVTREVVRTFMGYSSSLPIEEFRSIEQVLDTICKVALKPAIFVNRVDTERAEVGGVPGIWYRPQSETPIATILYLHGGGYVGTSPTMYAAFTAGLANVTGAEVFVADYRLAPEFPFPAGVEDAMAVIDGLEQICDGRPIFLAGDSGGGGLAASVVFALEAAGRHDCRGLLLFSPEADLELDQPSVTENAPLDILPWNIPTAPYLHGASASSGAVSAVLADVSHWPPTFVAYGGDEMFRDAIRILVAHLETAGIETHAIEAPGMFHVFPILMPWAVSSHRVGVEMSAFVSRIVDDFNGREAAPRTPA